MNEDETEALKQKVIELQRSIESLTADYFEISVRAETIRVLCENAAIFSQDDFEKALVAMNQRATGEGAAALENQRTSRIGWMRELLRRDTGDPH